MKRNKVVLAIPDQHFPFHHVDTIPFLRAVIREYQPKEFVNLGDEADYHALSEYDHDPDGMSAGDEHNATVESLKELYDLVPVSKVCTSNHTARPFRKAYKHGIPKAFMKDYREFLKAPRGWQWADSWEVDGVMYEHGEGFSGAQGALKSALANMQSTVIGHLHSFAGIQYSANPKHLVFGFNAGCLIDHEAYAFAYGKKLKHKPIVGCGIIDRGIPVFVPMQLDKHGRWIKGL